MRIGITGCRVLLNNEEIISGSIVINLEAGTVEAVREGAISKKEVDLFIELTRDYLALPGFVDIHVHCRDGELAYKETIETCTEAAAAGGVVLVFDMPNTRPPLNKPEVIERRLQEASSKAKVEYRVHAGVPEGLDLSLVDEYHKIGITSIKMYPEDYSRLVEEQKLEKFLEKLRKYNILLIAHCEDLDIVREREEMFEKTFENHNKIRPEEAELIAVKSLLRACYKTGLRRVHITHVSSPRTIELILDMKSLIPDLTFDITPHHALLCQEECLEKFREKPGLCKVNPPLRDKLTRNAIFANLVEGKADCVASDHAPHTLQEKLQSYEMCPPGFPGLETTSLLLLELWRANILTIHDVIRLYSWRPARICDVMEPVISVGAPAYLTIVKVGDTYEITGSRFRSKAKFTPFENLRVSTQIVLTIVRERIAYIDENDQHVQDLVDLVKS